MTMTAVKSLAARTLHIFADDVPWVPTAEGFEQRILHARPDEGFVVTQFRAQPYVTHGWHRHTAPVYGYTTAGAWGHDQRYDYRPGCYIFETPMVVHRFLNGPEVSEAVMINTSIVEFVDPATMEVTSTVTLEDMVDGYFARCEEHGIPRPDILN